MSKRKIDSRAKRHRTISMAPIYKFTMIALSQFKTARGDKALACHAGSRGSNPDITKKISAPIFPGTPATFALSLTMPADMCYCMNACQGR